MTKFGNNPLDDEVLRIRVVLAGMLLVLGFLAASLWRIQVSRGAQYESNQMKQSVRSVRLPGIRGRMFDRHGAVLADNRPSYCVALYLEELRQSGAWSRTVDKVEATLAQLGELLGTPSTLTRDDIRAHIRRRLPLPLIAWRDLDEETLARFAERAMGLPGVGIDIDVVRFYPSRKTACHTLGYVGRADPTKEDEEEAYHYYLPEMIGRSGLEKSLDAELRGEAGGRILRVDVSGYPRGEVGHRDPKDGTDMQLAIDLRIQRMAEEALGDSPGAVVVMDPNNGEILAMASMPGFDPNKFLPRIRQSDWDTLLKDPDTPLVNRAAAGAYAPGSTFKPITAFAALESGKCRASDTHECPGYFQLGRATFRCWQHSGHGVLTMRQSLERSCNVYFFRAALECGPDHVAHMARAIGLGSKTGIELEFEVAGLVPDGAWKRRVMNDGWRDGDTCNISIGQGALTATPLQMAIVASTLANGGTVYRPRLIKGRREAGSQLFVRTEPVVANRMNWEPSYVQTVRGGMRDVVNSDSGTAKALKMPNIVVAGKTGTAEFGRKEDRKRHAWMLSFAPFDAPKVAVAMIVDEGVSGGETVAPRMRKLMDGIFGVAEPADGGEGNS